MGKLVVSEFVSLDGVMEDPRWTFEFDRGPEGEKFKLDEVLEADALLLGRVTYQGFAEAWPSRTDDEGFADKMNSMPKFVVSTTMDDAEWNNSTLIKDDVVEEISKLRREPDQTILVAGSRKLTRTLMENDLVDEYRLMVFPVVLGSGMRMFEDGIDTTRLRLTDMKTVGEGVLILTYEPEAEEAETAG